MRIRRASFADLAALIELDRQSATSAGWTREQYLNLLGEENSQRRLCLVLLMGNVRPTPGSRKASLPDPPGEIAAWLVANKVDTEWELENIVVAEKLRRQGLGRKLLQALIDHMAEAGGKIVFLEVRESNYAARALYEQFEFNITGRRKNYYANPAEDAILYQRVVKKV